MWIAQTSFYVYQSLHYNKTKPTQLFQINKQKHEKDTNFNVLVRKMKQRE